MDTNSTSHQSAEILTNTRRAWLLVTNLLTFWIPTISLSKIGNIRNASAQVAWREKLALNIIILLFSGLLLFMIIGLSLVLCPKSKNLSPYEIETRSSLNRPLVQAYGHYYKISKIFNDHVNEARWLSEKAFEATTLGRDVSAMFVKLDFWEKYCGSLPKPPTGWDNIVREIPEKSMTVWMIHNGKTSAGASKDYFAQLASSKVGMVALGESWVKQFYVNNPQKGALLIAYDRIYDVTPYLDPVFNVTFLGDNFQKLIQSYGQTGKDATKLVERIKATEGIKSWQQKMNCIDSMFLVGSVDHRGSPQCLISDYITLSSSIFVVMIIGFKFFAAVTLSSAKYPEKQVKPIQSVVNADYENKLMFIIADGMVKGAGNDDYTPDIILKILNPERSRTPLAKSYQALGEAMLQLNFAKVYFGHHISAVGNSVPYIVVVKVGDVLETIKPGNRGKRDSQLILMRFLSKIHSKADLTPLEVELYNIFKDHLKLDCKSFEFLLWVDSDTEIYPDSPSHFVSQMCNDSEIIGICGETLLRNEGKSWITMIQVYEYFITHNFSKAFESLFGTVTCLPGCFSMYRIWSPDSGKLFLGGQKIVAEYGYNKVDTLHLKNLLSLGEDRYLTTLMLKTYPEAKLKFIADAKALTNAPECWSVLLSQRRRWINSTVHNLLELMMLNNLCGCCLFSIRFVVIMELFSTVMAPSGFLYVLWLAISLLTDDSVQIPLISIIIICSIYGLQVIIFVLKQEWQHLGWMIIYLIALPVYSFWLPLYSFWHFDDFSWGNTRRVDVESSESGRSVAKEGQHFNPNMVKLKSQESMRGFA